MFRPVSPEWKCLERKCGIPVLLIILSSVTGLVDRHTDCRETMTFRVQSNLEYLPNSATSQKIVAFTIGDRHDFARLQILWEGRPSRTSDHDASSTVGHISVLESALPEIASSPVLKPRASTYSGLEQRDEIARPFIASMAD